MIQLIPSIGPKTTAIIRDYGDRATWARARTSSIGSSDAAAILGVGYANQSPLSVWADKVSPQEETEADRERFLCGNVIEPAIRKLFSITQGLAVDYMPNVIFQSADHYFMTASLDGWVVDDDGPAVLECKNVSGFHLHEWREDSEAVLQYNVQTQHQLAVTGWDRAYLMGLIGGNQWAVKTIERDQEFIDLLTQREAEFWQFVANRCEPPADSTVATARALARLHPDDNGETVSLPMNLQTSVREIQERNVSINRIQGEIEFRKNSIKQFLGDNTFGELSDGKKVSWKTQERKATADKYASKTRVLRLPRV